MFVLVLQNGILRRNEAARSRVGDRQDSDGTVDGTSYELGPVSERIRLGHDGVAADSANLSRSERSKEREAQRNE